jgi:hypothetical protein
MEPEGSLPHSQVPATYLYSEPAQSSPFPHILKIHFNIILSSTNFYSLQLKLSRYDVAMILPVIGLGGYATANRNLLPVSVV